MHTSVDGDLAFGFTPDCKQLCLVEHKFEGYESNIVIFSNSIDHPELLLLMEGKTHTFQGFDSMFHLSDVTWGAAKVSLAAVFNRPMDDMVQPTQNSIRC